MKLNNNLFIVSCQALEDEPMYGPGVIERLVKSALLGGAGGIRISQRENIKTIMDLVPKDIPLIGITKKKFDDSEVFITPDLDDLKFLIDSKIPIIAIDATLRKRPKESLEELVSYFKSHNNNQLLMADCSNIDDVKNAFELDFDIISTTLRGYTSDTKDMPNIFNNYQFLKDIVKLNKKYNKYIIAEGGFNTPQSVAKAFKIGANGVVVGSAITRPTFITQQFVNYLKINK
ncbi:N-acetylmannosamine-6-phosphate 2-epimerase [Mycoplasmopsis caviae]|nr:N-acetylmannosamine-6-phosphate 2-epimerase [Mycoplasmopsis caviae]